MLRKVAVKGKVKGWRFHAVEVLTKWSKYVEALDGKEVKNRLIKHDRRPLLTFS